MKKNMGLIDRTIRTLLAVVVFILYLTDMISGAAAIILGSLALLFLVTSFIGLCPLYSLFGWSSKKKTTSDQR